MTMLPPFGWGEVFGRWQFGPVVTVLAVAAAVLYLEGAWRIARRHHAHRQPQDKPWPWWRTGLFLAGLAVLVVATEGGVGVYSDTLFWDHMIQHLMLIMVAPVLLVAGQPVSLLLRASDDPLRTWVKRAIGSRVATALTWPPFGIVAYTATIVGTHLTGLMNVIMSNAAVRDGEHVLYLVVGCLFFLPLVGGEPFRREISYPARLLVLFLTMPVDTFTGLILGYSNTPMTGMGARPSWAPSAISDLHSGGAVMWIGGDAIMFAVMMLVFLAWSRDGLAASSGGWLESARQASFAGLTGTRPAGETADAADAGDCAPAGGGPDARDRGTIDDDEHLAAYNEFLARINAAEARQAGRKNGPAGRTVSEPGASTGMPRAAPRRPRPP
jgi:cytochrome c oxidase assembly factor CtaG